MVITCIAILAVDFKIFPRRFAKVETWGTSLMDMGVGSFVFSAGLISARPLLKTGATSLKSALRHSLPLLALGLIRLYSVKGLDYAEHVSEYGVHWNFFFTLALLPPSVALLHLNPHLMALSISCLLQTVLDFTSLKDWILTAPRNNLISQNREGLFSFFGYLSIFLIGQAIGFDILPRNRDNIRIKMTLLMRLFLWSAWFSLLLFLTSYRTLVSRRLANLPYVLWVSAFNCAQLALFCTIESLLFPGLYSSADQSTESRKCKNATSLVLGSFNRNGLAIFLLANLLTGFVNLSMDTLNANRITSMTVLIVYVGSLTIIATTLHRYNISIKF